MGFGQWLDEGGRYRVRMGSPQYYANYQKSRVDVQIQDTMTGKIEQRIGYGEQMGNFHPVWVNWKGRKIQTTVLLRRN